MKIKEIRHIHEDDLRALCIEHNWFTHGNNKEYNELFNMVRTQWNSRKSLTAASLLKIAEYIQEYSDPDTYEILELEGMVYCLCEISHSCFQIEE